MDLTQLQIASLVFAAWAFGFLSGFLVQFARRLLFFL